MEIDKALIKINIEGDFSMNDFSTTHNQILYRYSKYIEEDDIVVNKDILFEGVCYINLPLTFSNFQIIDVKPDIITDDTSKTIVYVNSIEKKWFVICDRVLYQENNLGIDETSIPCKRNQILNISELGDLIQRIASGDIPETEEDDLWKQLM